MATYSNSRLRNARGTGSYGISTLGGQDHKIGENYPTWGTQGRDSARPEYSTRYTQGYLGAYRGRANQSEQHQKDIASHRGGGKRPFGAYQGGFFRNPNLRGGVQYNVEGHYTQYGEEGDVKYKKHTTYHADASNTTGTSIFAVSGDVGDLYQTLGDRYDPDLAFKAVGGEIIDTYDTDHGTIGIGFDVQGDSNIYQKLLRHEEHQRQLYTASFFQ